MTNQVVTDGETTPGNEATNEVAEEQDSQTPDELTTWRRRAEAAEKRQSSEAAAKAEAQRQLAEYRQKLAAYETAEQQAKTAEMTAEARLQAQLDAEKRRADEAEAKATARYLDRVYPGARKEYPEITDEVRLAKLEALLSGNGTNGEAEAEAATRAMRAPRTTTAVPADQESSKDIFARLKKTGINPFVREA